MSSYSHAESAREVRASAPAQANSAYIQLAQESWAPQSPTTSAVQPAESNLIESQSRNCHFPEVSQQNGIGSMQDSNQLMLEASVALNKAAFNSFSNGDVFNAMNDFYLSGELSNQVLSDWPAVPSGSPFSPVTPGSSYLPPFTIGSGAPTDSTHPFSPEAPGSIPHLPPSPGYGPAWSNIPDTHPGLNPGAIAGGLVGDSLALPTIVAGGFMQGAGSFIENTGNSVMNAGVDMLGNPVTTMIGIPVATVGAAADAAGWAVDQIGNGAVAVGDAVVNAVESVGSDIGDAVSSAFSWL